MLSFFLGCGRGLDCVSDDVTGFSCYFLLDAVFDIAFMDPCAAVAMLRPSGDTVLLSCAAICVPWLPVLWYTILHGHMIIQHVVVRHA